MNYKNRTRRTHGHKPTDELVKGRHSIRAEFDGEEIALIEQARAISHGPSRAYFMRVAALQRAERLVFGKTKTPD